MATAVATKLVVEYFDEELQERRIEEQISDVERTATESKNSIEFLTSNGSSERVYLGPTDYSQP